MDATVEHASSKTTPIQRSLTPASELAQKPLPEVGNPYDNQTIQDMRAWLKEENYSHIAHEQKVIAALRERIRKAGEVNNTMVSAFFRERFGRELTPEETARIMTGTAPDVIVNEEQERQSKGLKMPIATLPVELPTVVQHVRQVPRPSAPVNIRATDGEVNRRPPDNRPAKPKRIKSWRRPVAAAVAALTVGMGSLLGFGAAKKFDYEPTQSNQSSPVWIHGEPQGSENLGEKGKEQLGEATNVQTQIQQVNFTEPDTEKIQDKTVEEKQQPTPAPQPSDPEVTPSPEPSPSPTPVEPPADEPPIQPEPTPSPSGPPAATDVSVVNPNTVTKIA